MTQNIYDDEEFFAFYSRLGRSVEGLDGAPESGVSIAQRMGLRPLIAATYAGRGAATISASALSRTGGEAIQCTGEVDRFVASLLAMTVLWAFSF